MKVEVGLHLVLVVLGDRDEDFVEDDAEAIDEGCLGHVNDIGTVGTQELGLGQILLKLLHRHERHDLVSIFQIEPHVVFQSFDIQNIVETDALEFVIGLNEHEAVATVGVLPLNDGEPLQGLVGGLEEVLVGNGLQQIVESVD